MRYILEVKLHGESGEEEIDYSKTEKLEFEVYEWDVEHREVTTICTDRGIRRDRLWHMSLWKEFDSIEDALKTEESCAVVHFRYGSTQIERKFLRSSEIR